MSAKAIQINKSNDQLGAPGSIPRNLPLLYLWGAAIAFGAFVMGYFFVIVTVLSSTLTFHMSNGGQSEQQPSMSVLLSICTTSLPIGGLLGSLMYSNVFGAIRSENRLMVVTDICMILTLCMQALSLDIYVYTFLRLVQGFIIGIYGIVTPQYIMSISPTKISGQMGSFFQIMITIGIAAAYAMGYVIDNNDLGDAINWRLCVLLPIPFCIMRVAVCNYFSFDRIETHVKRRDWRSLFEYIEMFYEKGTLTLKDLIMSKNIAISGINELIPNSRE